MGRKKRCYSVKDVEAMRWKCMELSPKFADLLGEKEEQGMWIIYGKSGQGKTRFALELAKEFGRMGKKTMLMSLEMGMSLALQGEMDAAGLRGGIHKITVYERLSPEELEAVLARQRSPKVVIIDSVQYWQAEYGVTWEQVLALRRRFYSKIFVFLSHVEGKEVEGRLAYMVKRDCSVRLLVEGFKALFIGRGKGGRTGEYVIWEEGAARYWLKDSDRTKEQA